MSNDQANKANVEARLAQLRLLFAKRAASDLTALETAAGKFSREGTALARDEIRRIAHSLAGAGGTFGFAPISRSAAALEDFIGTDPSDSELCALTRETVAAIRRELSSAASQPDRQTARSEAV